MKTLTLEPIPATEPQIDDITMVGQTALKKAVKDLGLSKDSAQKVHGSPEWSAGIYKATLDLLREISDTNKHKSEEVASNYDYYSGYRNPNGVTAQCKHLREIFGDFGSANQSLLRLIEKGEVKSFINSEGWFAIPNWTKNHAIFGMTYTQAVQVVLNKLRETHEDRFYNYREGQLNDQQFKQSDRTKTFLATLSSQQGNPAILLVPAQFGLWHRGHSVRRAKEVFKSNEFGLGAFAVGSMLLTHPERLASKEDLSIDMLGDEFDDSESDQRFCRAPFFSFDSNGLKFATRFVGWANERYGSATGFLPHLTSK